MTLGEVAKGAREVNGEKRNGSGVRRVEAREIREDRDGRLSDCRDRFRFARSDFLFPRLGVMLRAAIYDREMRRKERHMGVLQGVGMGDDCASNPSRGNRDEVGRRLANCGCTSVSLHVCFRSISIKRLSHSVSPPLRGPLPQTM